MAVSLHHIVVDAYDLPGLACFWCGVLDWRVLSEKPREVVIGPGEFAGTGICFMPVSEPKTVKNRLHFDLAPDDQETEVERILALGARRVDIGQGEAVGWVVLADPEGNEFCVLRPKASLIAFRDVPG
ncbi:VOC family protein [Streptomyces sp. R08]|uniref:VOC family protein n=1 Tax=Streptomyces sp. R08 TaxID=3238624 RepID=A0AB39M6A6_9ACTN